MAPLLILLEPVVLTLYLDSFLTTTLLFKNSEPVFLFIPIMPTFHDCSYIPDSVLKVLYLLPHLILKLGVSKLSIKGQMITHSGFSNSLSATQLCHYSVKTTIDNK